MLVSLVPLFDENMAVKAYSIFTQKNNFLLNPLMLGTACNDGAPRIDGLELLEMMGVETISSDKNFFVTVTNTSIFLDIESVTTVPKNRLILLMDNTIPPVEMYLNRIRELKEKGFKLAMRKLHVTEFEEYRGILEMMDYVFLNVKKISVEKIKLYFEKLLPNVIMCAGNIDSAEVFDEIKALGACQLFEGSFFTVPVTKGQTDIAPLKANYIELLNIVNDDNYDLTKAADIIGRDTALTISLLKIVNKFARNSEITSIRHAAAMLGQRELKRWIRTAVVNELYADKPNEIMRLSLIRAKFAENLAKNFTLAMKTDELFIMGLFSVLDVILEKPMSEALKDVHVTKDVYDALVNGKGKLADVINFIKQYEIANWSEVSRVMLLSKIDMKDVYNSYVDALVWYRKIYS